MKCLTTAMMLFLSVAAGTTTVHAADPGAGEALAGEQCATCHGPAGISQNPEWPTLAGQYADYLERSMRQYRSGERQDPVMQGMAADLSDEDIRNLAAWYASQEGLEVIRY